MVRIISQETFDAVVKENMEEFNMDREEAVKEAKEQFESQVHLFQSTKKREDRTCEGRVILTLVSLGSGKIFIFIVYWHLFFTI